MLQNSFQSPVEAVVRSAWRRRHSLLLLDQLSYALIAVLCGAILLLLLGTQILSWYWLALLALCGVSVGVVRLRGRFLPHYQIAQILDRRLQLSDALSTAWFLLTTTPSHANSQRHLQMKQAEELAAGVRPQIAFPFEGRRSWTVSALLLAVACGLFGIRYLAYDQLTFKPTLIPLRFTSALEQLEAKFLPGTRPAPAPEAKRQAGNGSTPQESRSNSKNTMPAPREGEEAAKDASRFSGDRQAGHRPSGDAPKKSTNEKGKSNESLANNSASPTAKSLQQRPPANDPANKNGKDRTTKGSSSGEQSLTSKLKDALSGLLAKMEGGSSPQPPSGEANQKPSANRDKNGAAPSNKEQSGAENAASKTNDASSLQAQQPGRSAEATAASRGQGNSDSSGHRSSDTQSAAGRQDGSKEAREAEQLKAMGKLAQIIGKRSANVTGEMTVETPSGKQQLQTNYTYQSGRHTGIGSEINHEEVPAEDQQYVREYMKQVHAEPESK